MTTRPLTRFLPAVAVLSAAALLSTSSPSLAAADRIRTEGELIRYSNAVPAGAQARVQAVYTAGGDSVVTLHTWGLAPNTEYGAHAHVGQCDDGDPLAAGGHFQKEVGGATDPAYANPTNEIWLDFTTDEFGNAVAQTVVPWQFDADRRAQSVVVHQHHTHTGDHGPAGTAGARLACLSVDF